MSINVVQKIDDLVKVRNVLVSVSDKNGLDELIPRLTRINPEIKLFSTVVTFKRIKEIIGEDFGSYLTQV